MNRNNQVEAFPEHIETLYKLEPPYTKVEGGHGCYGVVLWDRDADKIQCHVCGKWFKQLHTHARFAHKLSGREYKEEYGLSLKTPLCNRALSKMHSDVSTRTYAKNKDELIALVKKRKNTKRAKRRQRKSLAYTKNCAAHLNNLRVCENQMRRRYEIIQEVSGQEFPSEAAILEHDRQFYHTVFTRYGGLNKFREEIMSQEVPAYLKKDHWTEVRIIAAIRKLHHDERRLPRAMDFQGKVKGKGIPSLHTIKNHFGSWSRALVIALGLDEKRRSA